MSSLPATPFTYPNNATITEILLKHNLNNTADDRAAIIDGISGKVDFTYSSLRQGVQTLATYFASELYIKPGDVVGILSFPKVAQRPPDSLSWTAAS